MSTHEARRSLVGSVMLVGAGPGDPGLITVKGLAAIRNADVIIFDRLISRELLTYARSGAELIDAGKLPKAHTLSQDKINELIVGHALLGKHVIRLKGGDPYIYGRGWEERQACIQHGIPVEVVPGITSAIAVPALAGIPVTARGIARTFAIVTPQSESGMASKPLDYAALAKIDTLSVLMSREQLSTVVAGLIDAGRSTDTPAAIIERGATPQQRVMIGTLETIVDLADREEIQSPAVVVIGDVAALSNAQSQPADFQQRLRGKRVLVTRPVTASPPLIALLEREGAVVVDAPLIRIEHIEPLVGLDISVPYQWAVFTSLHGVRGFFEHLHRHGLDARVLAGARVAAVGPKTSEELRRFGILADLVPEEYRASGLIQAITGQRRASGESVLYPCGTLAREELAEGLRGAGFVVDEIRVYETHLQPLPHAIYEQFSDQVARTDKEFFTGRIDAILLHSPSGATSLARENLDLSDVVIGCIGPTTAKVAAELGLKPTVVPSEHTDAALVEGLIAELDHLQNGSERSQEVLA